MNTTQSNPSSKLRNKLKKRRLRKQKNFNIPANKRNFMIAILKYNAGNVTGGKWFKKITFHGSNR
jgi:hypothetical protein